MSSEMSPSELRKHLGHPVIDNDGHYAEIPEVIAEFIAEVGTPKDADKYLKLTYGFLNAQLGKGYSKTLEERRDAWAGKTSWWSFTANSYDRASAFFPALYRERMEELGFDYCVAYPSIGLFTNRIEGDDELRQIACRAFNIYSREMFAGLSDKMTPIAVIPTHTPQEAIAEIEYTVRENGSKTILLASGSRRNIPKIAREHPELAHLVQRTDFYGMDSEYDYDPFWAKCQELKLPISFHGQTVGTWAGPISPSSNIFNRLGGSNSYPPLALALLLGGVTSRFPRLKFQFAEAGVGWMTILWKSVYELWKKRGIEMERINPANLDIPKMIELGKKYGTGKTLAHVNDLKSLGEGLVAPEQLNEFDKVKVSSKQELKEHFTSRFYGGAEADDPSVAWGFHQNAGNATMRMTFGSDIAHWDVADAMEVLPEAYELVEKGWINTDQLKQFLFTNAARLYTDVNPDFFKGTVLEKSVWEHLEAKN